MESMGDGYEQVSIVFWTVRVEADDLEQVGS
jgi:hypothetical protein